jgi:serine/threonine-protein kinase
MLGWMGAAFAKGGKPDEARKIIGELEHRLKNKDKGSIAFFIAVIYSALGEETMAMDWLDRSRADHEMEMPWLMTEPQFYNLHDHSRFKMLAQQMNFPQLG